jgi:hypothetical protein
MSPSQRRTSEIPPINLCVCMCIPPIVARQRLSKKATVATDTYPTIEELLDDSSLMRSVSYHRKLGD